MKEFICAIEEGTTQDGRKFNKYYTQDENGKTIRLKFRQEVELPKEPCILVISEGNYNYTKELNPKTARFRRVMWVSKIDEIKSI